MTVDSKTSSKVYTITTTRRSSIAERYGMSTDLSTIWLLRSSRDQEAMFGLARTMMVMSSQI